MSISENAHARRIQRAKEALEKLDRSAYRAGVAAGLSAAEQIAGYLTMQPDTDRQRKQRQWAEALIRRYRQSHGLEGKD